MYVSGFQPSGASWAENLGLRPGWYGTGLWPSEPDGSMSGLERTRLSLRLLSMMISRGVGTYGWQVSGQSEV